MKHGSWLAILLSLGLSAGALAATTASAQDPMAPAGDTTGTSDTDSSAPDAPEASADAPSEDAPAGDAAAPPPPPPPATEGETSPGEADSEAGADSEASSADPMGGDSVPRRRADPGTDTADVTSSGLMSDEQTITEEQLGVETVRRGTDPYEDPNKRYIFLGGFYRHHWIPASIVELFVQSSPSANNPQFGAELTLRKDGFEIVISGYYAQFDVEGPFLANGDPITDMEIIDSNLSAAFAGVTFMWSRMFNDYIGIQFGLGLGAGYVFGDLVRTEAYPSAAGGWRPCVTPTAGGLPGSEQPGDSVDFSRSNGRSIQDYCQPATDDTGGTNPPVTNEDGEEGAHYGVTARRWTGGGSVPNVYFRLAPQISIRFKPIHQLVFRIDGGFDIFSGAYVGGAVGIGLN